MIHQRAIAPTSEGSRILQRLCFHFSRKVQTHYDAQQGTVRFPWGVCDLYATHSSLSFVCSAETEEALASGRQVIDGHMALFTRKSPMALCWEEPQPGHPLKAG